MHTLLYALFSFRANRLTAYSNIVENCDPQKTFLMAAAGNLETNRVD
jgi:hypothetical protein